MGMYTELHFNAELRRDTPPEVLEVLRFMLGEVEAQPQLPDHALFSAPRWRMVFRCDSYYFDADTHSTLRFDDISCSHYLCIRANLKNYDDEIDKFVDWITPYLDKREGDFLGFKRYEEDEDPTLIHHPARFTSTALSSESGTSGTPCARCGGPCVEFTVPNDVWNAVVRLGGSERDDEYICEACYRKAVESWIRSASTATTPTWRKAPPYWRPKAHAYVMFSSPFIEGIFTTVGSERYILSVQPFPEAPK